MKRGLVLEGGGVKGSYQIGSYYAFKDCNIRLDGFVGTSIGSFNACMLSSGKYKELLNFWYNIDPGYLFDFDQYFVDAINNGILDIKTIKGGLLSIRHIIKNMGVDNKRMVDSVRKIVSYKDLINSKKDFGLVTCKVSHKGVKPVYIYKSNIYDKDNLIDYLMASCYLPIFKEKRIIDDHYYIDGGFYDNVPTKLLIDIGYKEIYDICINGIGIDRNVTRDGVKIIRISPSRNNGHILEVNKRIIKDNIMMGYYDTLRVLKNLDGYKYCFKRKNECYYKFLCRKVSKRLYNRVANFFDAKTYKDTVIKALEYVLEKDEMSYYDVYNSYSIIKRYKYSDNKHFIYSFIKEIKR